ncbi:MAG: hypothetical protein WAU29_11770 [Chitinophagaceae bacterium]
MACSLVFLFNNIHYRALYYNTHPRWLFRHTGRAINNTTLLRVPAHYIVVNYVRGGNSAGGGDMLIAMHYR